MAKMLCVLLLLCSPALGAEEWLNASGMFNGWYKEWTDQAIAQMKDMPFVIGVPADKKVIEKTHKQGTKVLTYVTFYQMPPGQTYQQADLAEHPDWNIIRPDGSIGISCFEGSENTGWKTVCPNSPAFRDYALKYTQFIMDQGADGLFIDNGHPDVVCEGPKFDKHEHIYPGKDNIHAYRKLLEDVRAKVKTFGKDKIIIVNPGGPNPAWVGACDGQMFESYICTWASKTRWHSEAQLLQTQRTWGPIADQGNALLCLSYLGHTEHSIREDAFYCYAWARVSGFLWADWFTGKDDIQDLYKLRLGKAVGPMQKGDGIYTREFEKGLVAVSSESRGATLKIDGKKHTRAFDVFAKKALQASSSGDFTISLDKGQGRVYLYQ